jgi:hypothetical protein
MKLEQGTDGPFSFCFLLLLSAVREDGFSQLGTGMIHYDGKGNRIQQNSTITRELLRS